MTESSSPGEAQADVDAAGVVRLDATDVRLLERLQRDADLTNQALAAQIHVSPATALRRTQALKRAGIVERIVALLAPQRLGPLLQAVVEVTLEHQGRDGIEAFAQWAAARDEVQQCYRMASGPDFVLLLVLRDMAQYDAWAERLHAAGLPVRNLRSYFVQRRLKFTTALPLPGRD